MWISKKKWQELEKRIADLEELAQSQPTEIVENIAKHLQTQMTKSISRRHREQKNQSDGQA